MFAVLSDTHSTRGNELAGRAREAVERADRVLHAGDFTTVAALDAFYDAAERLDAVYGNADSSGVQSRLPEGRVVDCEGVRVAITHRRRGGESGLVMFGREKDADLVVSGHTHRPRFVPGDPALLNPGSHADPRGNPAAHAELEGTDAGVEGTIRTREGDVLTAVSVETK